MKVMTDFPQGSDRWREVHLGIPTASEFKKIITPAKGELSASHREFAARLVGERITGGFDDVKELFDIHIIRGIEHEPRALAAYQYKTGAYARSVGFVTNDEGTAGCSPDGLVYQNEGDALENPIGGLEFKCPTFTKFLMWQDEGVLPLEHKCQVHGSLAVTGLPWWDFVAFHAQCPDRPFIVRVTPDKFTESVKDALAKFLKITDELYAKIKERLA